MAYVPLRDYNLPRFSHSLAEKAFMFALQVDPHNRTTSGSIKEKLEQAKKIYDFLDGASHHFPKD